jgi:hypothetical protein
MWNSFLIATQALKQLFTIHITMNARKHDTKREAGDSQEEN